MRLSPKQKEEGGLYVLSRCKAEQRQEAGRLGSINAGPFAGPTLSLLQKTAVLFEGEHPNPADLAFLAPATPRRGIPSQEVIRSAANRCDFLLLCFNVTHQPEDHYNIGLTNSQQML